MTVAIKANLVTGAAENKAVTTHPELVAALCEMLVERGAEVIVGDSPGGLFTRGALRVHIGVPVTRESRKRGRN